MTNSVYTNKCIIFVSYYVIIIAGKVPALRAGAFCCLATQPPGCMCNEGEQSKDVRPKNSNAVAGIHDRATSKAPDGQNMTAENPDRQTDG